MANEAKPATPAEAIGGCLVLLVPLLWIGSCVFGGETAEEKQEAQRKATEEQVVAKELAESNRKASGAAQFANDPLISEGNRKSPTGDGFAYAISALGHPCNQSITVRALSKPMKYEVICSNGSTGTRLNFVKYRLDTAAGISELID